MAVTYKPKRNGSAGVAPTTSQLADFELAVNYTDKKMYMRVGTNIVLLSDYNHTHSIAQVSGLQSALNAKAPINSPTFTGPLSAAYVAHDGPALGTQYAHGGLRRGGYVNWQYGTEADGSLSVWSYDSTGGYLIRAIGLDKTGAMAVNSLSTLTANGSYFQRVPRTFVQSSDPGAAASDCDLWAW